MHAMLPRQQADAAAHTARLRLRCSVQLVQVMTMTMSGANAPGPHGSHMDGAQLAVQMEIAATVDA